MSENTLDFTGMIDALLDGKRVTRKEWNDKRWWGVLQDDILQIHKAGEKNDVLRPWIMSNGDLSGDDWEVL